MFEDVVGSTMLISEIGDDAWGRLSVHDDRLARDCIEDHGGRVIRTAGDDSMCTLPGRGRDPLREQSTRSYAHWGLCCGSVSTPAKCERIGNDLADLAVHVAARIGAAAAPGETLVSRTVSDLVSGSSINFASLGIEQPEGVPDDWELLAATGSTTGGKRSRIASQASRD